MAYTPITLSPVQGGDLITNFSHENVGPANYVTKRDWRRDFDTEIRREGTTFFRPNTDVELGEQANPGGETEPITLLHMGRAATGQTCVFAGNKANVYRYLSLDNAAVYAPDGDDSPTYEETGDDAPAFFLGTGDESITGNWILIGSGFSEDGHRWEAVNVNGKTVFNNGVDLPWRYDPVTQVSEPLYELREQGIAAVGCIEEFNGLLVMGNILEIIAEELDEVLLGVDSNPIEASQFEYTVTASADAFLPTDVGKDIIFDSVARSRIVEYLSPVSVRVDVSRNAAAEEYHLAVGYGPVPASITTNRTRYRVLWSGLGDSGEYGAAGPATATATDATLTLDYPLASLAIGDEITVIGAGISGGNLETSITDISDGGLTIEMDDVAITSGDVEIRKTSGLSTISGYVDLQDDSSGILRLTQTLGRLIVCKETSFFVGRLTGDPIGVFAFDKLYSGTKSLAWPYMLASVGGRYLIYAGQTRFYSLSLSGSDPQEHPKLSLCDGLFFKQSPSHEEQDNYFAGVNDTTNEVWFKMPGDTDQLLCYDYVNDSCSTSSLDITAMASVLRPAPRIDDSTKETWCVLGTDDGLVLQYGLTDRAQPFWTRQDENYDSIIKSGLVSGGDDFNQKDWRTYILFGGTSTDTLSPIQVKGYSATSPGDTPTLKFTRTLPTVTSKNMIPVFFRGNYFQDEIKVTGSALPFRITRRLYEMDQVRTRGFTRVSDAN